MTVLALDPILTRRAEVQRIAASSARQRKLRSRLLLVGCGACVLTALAPLVWVLSYTVDRGVAAWSVDFFTHLPTPEGIAGGGIWNSIVGSFIIDAIAGGVAIPLGVVIGLFLAANDSPVAGGIRFVADVLSGVPSITVGIFAYGLLVTTLHHFSAIAGSFGVGIIMLPVVVRGSETALRTVPKHLGEAALSLGAKDATVTWRVLLPAALPGLITGVLLAVARGAGESAPLLFTAVGSQYLALNPLQEMASLPLTIYQDGIQAYPDLQQAAWGTGLALVVFVLVLSISSRFVSARLGRRMK